MLLIQPLGDRGRRLKVQGFPQLYVKCEPRLQEILKGGGGIKNPLPTSLKTSWALEPINLDSFVKGKA